MRRRGLCLAQLACEPPIQQATHLVNTPSSGGERRGSLTSGTAQVVMADAVADSGVPRADLDDLARVVAVSVSSAAADAQAVQATNQQATPTTLDESIASLPAVDGVLLAVEHHHHRFFDAARSVKQ